MQQTSISQDWSDYNEPTQSNILIPGLIASPCKHHPSFDGPCPRLNDPKDHFTCDNCGPRRIGFADCWDPRSYVERPAPEPSALQVAGRKGGAKPKKKVAKNNNCEFPGCECKVVKGYCHGAGSNRHSGLVVNRRTAWQKQNPGIPVPIEWLHRPVKENRNLISHRIARELGHKSLVDAMKALYYGKRMSLKHVGSVLKMSDCSVSKGLRAAGCKLRRSGIKVKR